MLPELGGYGRFIEEGRGGGIGCYIEGYGEDGMSSNAKNGLMRFRWRDCAGPSSTGVSYNTCGDTDSRSDIRACLSGYIKN